MEKREGKFQRCVFFKKSHMLPGNWKKKGRLSQVLLLFSLRSRLINKFKWKVTTFPICTIFSCNFLCKMTSKTQWQYCWHVLKITTPQTGATPIWNNRNWHPCGSRRQNHFSFFSTEDMIRIFSQKLFKKSSENFYWAALKIYCIRSHHFPQHFDPKMRLFLISTHKRFLRSSDSSTLFR